MTEMDDERPPLLGLVDEDLSKQNPKGLRFKLFVPSLQHMASFKVALTLWLQKWAEKIDHSFTSYEIMRKMAPSVYEMVLLPVIPQLLKEKLAFDVHKIKEQITYFWEFLWQNVCAYKNQAWYDISSIVWTTRGNIDYIKTLEMMRDDKIKYKNEIMSLYDIDDKMQQSGPPLNFNKFIMNERILSNRNHSVMVEYWNCEDNGKRLAIIYEWLSMARKKGASQQDVFFILARLSEGMLKNVLQKRYNDVLLYSTIFFSGPSYCENYFLPLACFLRAVVPSYDFGKFAKHVDWYRSQLKYEAIPLVYDYYMNFCDEFALFLSESESMSLESIFYAVLLRRQFDTQFVKSLLSGLTDESKGELLAFKEYGICCHLLATTLFKYFKTFVELCCPEKLHVAKFKSNFLNSEADEIGHIYYDLNNYEGLMELLEWLGEGDAEKVNQFRSNVIWRHLDTVIWSSCVSLSDEMEFSPEKADSFLNWISSGDANKIIYLKEWYISYFSREDLFNKSDHTKSYLRRVVAWLYNHDGRKIKRFWHGPEHCHRAAKTKGRRRR